MAFGIEVVCPQLDGFGENNHKIVMTRRRTVLSRGVFCETSSDEDVSAQIPLEGKLTDAFTGRACSRSHPLPDHETQLLERILFGLLRRRLHRDNDCENRDRKSVV